MMSLLRLSRGTFQIVSSRREMRRTPHSATELIESIRMNADQIRNIRLLYDFGEAAFDYFINMVYAMLSGILTTWIQRGQRESAEEINDIFLKLTGRCFKDPGKGRRWHLEPPGNTCCEYSPRQVSGIPRLKNSAAVLPDSTRTCRNSSIQLRRRGE